MTDLDGRVAIVTGGARGLGEAYVRALHSAGARVVVADILDEAGEALATELGDRARFVHLDVTSEEGWDAVIRTTLEAFGAVDVLVKTRASRTPRRSSTSPAPGSGVATTSRVRASMGSPSRETRHARMVSGDGIRSP